MENRLLLAGDWQNAFNPLDISNDGIVVPLDAIVAINELNGHSVINSLGQLPNRATHSNAPYYDVNGDDVFTPLDELLVINALNGDQTSPSGSAKLTRDTGPDGTTNMDGVTFDTSITGLVFDDLTGVQLVRASVDGQAFSAVPISRTNQLRTHQFTFVPVLADGAHTVRFFAEDALGNRSSEFQLTFTVDATPPAAPSVDLTVGSDSGLVGDHETSSRRVAVAGRAPPGALLRLAETGANTTANAQGVFQFTDLSLLDGANDFHVSLSDDAGNIATTTLVVTRRGATSGSDIVLDWNNIALEAVRLDGSNPQFASRNLAIVQASVYDAVNAVQGLNGQFVTVSAPNGASIEAAVATAAHKALSELYPAQTARFNVALAQSLQAIPAGQAKVDGELVGREVAGVILEWRANDGSRDFANEEGSRLPGEWRATLPNFDLAQMPQWADLEPFLMPHPDSFPPPGAPALDSVEYAGAVEYVHDLGGVDSVYRTSDQTQIARFWADGAGTYTPPGHWNQIARTAALMEGNSIDANARMLAMLNVAMADAAIASWQAKYSELLWRPITAIREADTDGNDATVADPNWTPLLPTPPFPSYTSGHSMFSGAAATVLSSVFGNDVAFSIDSYSLPGVIRSFDNFDEAAHEASESRIYGGIHFPFDTEDGMAVGQSLGSYVLNAFAGDDRQAPRIVVISPNQQAAIAGVPTIAGRATDPVSGIDSLTVAVDDQVAEPVDFDPLTGEFSFVPTDIVDGAHSFRFQATDRRGNSSEYLVELVVDRLTPDLYMPLPFEGAILDFQSHVAGIADPTGSPLVQLSYQFDDGPAIPVPFDPTTYAYDEPIRLKNVDVGPHTFTLTAVDAAGNRSSQSVLVQLDNPVPFHISAFAPLEGSIDIGTTFRPKITFSRPVDPATLTHANFYISAGDTKLPATIVPATDGSFALLFPIEPMPGGSVVTVNVDGSTIRAPDGSTLDANASGAEGTLLQYQFTTVSRTGIPGTSIVGTVVDPGVDLHPMTRDDIRPGPDGLLNTGDDLYLNPIAGVTVYILGQESHFVQTGSDGRFVLDNIPAGNVKLVMDGRTATNSPTGIYFPEMVMDLAIQPGRVNTVMGTMGEREKAAALASVLGVYLPRLDNSLLQPIENDTESLIQVAAVAAPDLTPEQRAYLHATIPAGSLIGPDGQPLSTADVGISTVPPELVREMLPPGVMQLASTLTLQAPGVATFGMPVSLTVPNIYGAAPGSSLSFYSFDHTTGRLDISGTATVSADGLSAVSDPDGGIFHPGWFGVVPGTPTSNCDPQESRSSGPDPTVDDGDVEKLKSRFFYDDKGEFTLHFKNTQTDPEGKRLKVTLEIDGKEYEFLEGLKPYKDKPFFLCPQDPKDIRVNVKPLLDKIKDIEKDRLYGIEIHVKATPEDNESNLLIDKKIYIYRFLDAADDKHEDGTVEFAPTLIDGKAHVDRTREIEMHVGEKAKPKLELESDQDFSTKEGDPTKFVFDPTGDPDTAQPGLQTKLKIKAPDDKKVGDLTFLGDGAGRQKFYIDKASLIASLQAIASESASPSDVFYELIPAEERANFDQAGEQQAIADGVEARVKAIFSEFDYGVKFVDSSDPDGINIAFPIWHPRRIDIDIPFPAISFHKDFTYLFGDSGESALSIVGIPSVPGGSGIDDAEAQGALVKKAEEYSKSVRDFLLSKAINKKPGSNVEVYPNTHLAFPLQRIPFVLSADQLINMLAQTAAHEGTHTMGASHPASNTDNPVLATEEQEFFPEGKPYRLSFLNQSTGVLQPNAPASDVQNALNALSTIRGNVVVSGNPGGPYTVVFGNRMAGVNLPLLAGIHTDGTRVGVLEVKYGDAGEPTVERVPGGLNDLMYDGHLDWRGELRLVPGVSREVVKMALKLDWDQGDAQKAFSDISTIMGSGNGQSSVYEDGLHTVPAIEEPNLTLFDTDQQALNSSLDMGQVLIDGAAGAVGRVTLRLFNNGRRDLDISHVRVMDSTGSFTVSTIDPGTLVRPHTSIPLVVTFDPQRRGPLAARLVFETNDFESPTEITLTGFGLSPDGALVVEMPNNNLGGQGVIAGQTAATGMNLRNIGAAPLIVSEILIAAGSGEFRVAGLPFDFDANHPLTIDPGASYQVDVTFDPDRFGIRPGIIEIISNDPAQPTFQQHVVGTGIDPTNSLRSRDNNYVAVETPDISGAPVLRQRTSAAGKWTVMLPAQSRYDYSIFDPVSGLIGTTGGFSSSNGRVTLVGAPNYQASTEPDSDGDGLPDDVEFAVGTSSTKIDTNGDGLDDFTAVFGGLDPLATGLLPLGLIGGVRLSTSSQDLVVVGHPDDPQRVTAFVAGAGGMQIIDVSQISKPIVTGQLTLNGNLTSIGYDSANNLVAIAAGNVGIHIVDVSNRTKPVLLRTFSIPTGVLTVDNGRIYAASGDSLSIIDLGSGALLAQRKYAGGTIDDVVISAGFLYTVAHVGIMPHTVSKIELSTSLADPVASVIVNNHPTFGRMHIFAGDGLVFVGAADNNVSQQVPGVEILRDDGASLTLVGRSSPITAFDVTVNSSGLSLFTGASAQLENDARVGVLDVRDPTKTDRFLTAYDIPGAARAIEIAAGRAYIISRDGGLYVLNYLPLDTSGLAPAVSISSPIVDADTTAPGIQVLEASDIPVRVRAGDDQQVARVELLVNGQVVATDVTYPYDFTVTTPQRNSGATNVILLARALDTGGNVTFSNTLVYELIADTSAPVVVASAPGDGQQVTSVSGLAVVFNEEIDGGLIAASGISLTRDGVPVALRSVIASASRSISILPTASLEFGEYHLTIDSQIVADRVGNHLASPVSISFIVGTARVIATAPAPGSIVDTPVASIQLSFNTSMALQVPTPNDFQLVGAGPDHAFGTLDDIQVPVYALRSNGLNTQLTIALEQPLLPDTYRLTAAASKLLDRFGRALDGEFSGSFPSGDDSIGGDFVFEFTTTNAANLPVDAFPGRVFTNLDTTNIPVSTLFTLFSPIVTADVNADGRLDVLRTVQGQYFAGFSGGQQVFLPLNQVNINYGRANGGYADPVAYDVGVGASRISVGDVNGDQIADIVILDNPGNVNQRKPFEFSVLIGNGAGFLPERRVVTGLDSNEPGGMVLGDFDDDQILDLAVLVPGRAFAQPPLPSRVYWFKGLGDGTFADGTSTDLDGLTPEHQLLMGDLNNDQHLDLVATGHVLLGNGDGSFTTAAINLGDTLLALADLDGDGALDVVSSTSVTTQDYETGKFISNNVDVHIAHGMGNGAFAAPSTTSVEIDGTFGGDTYSRFVTCAVGDFDGDSKPDLVIGGAQGEFIPRGAVAVLTSADEYAFPISIPILNAGNRYQASTVAIGDANNDGSPDILASLQLGDSSTPLRTVIVLNQGNGSFQSPSLVTGLVSTNFNQLVVDPRAAADVDGDGIADLVRLINVDNGVDPSRLQVGLGNGVDGFGLFNDATSTPLPIGFGTNLLLGDVNHDDRVDAIVWDSTVHSTDHSLLTGVLLLGEVGGTFGAPRELLHDSFDLIEVRFGDVNNDGNLDLIRMGYFTGLIVQLGDGQGEFGPEIVSNYLQTGFTEGTFLLADVNNDGKLDAVNPSNNAALGQGDGTFLRAPRPSVGVPGGSAVLADINHDGKIDVVSGGVYQLHIGLGNGDGTFQDFYSLPIPSISSFDTQAADLDHDGIVDLILSSESEIDLLINNGDGTFQLPIRLDAPGLVRPLGSRVPRARVIVTDFDQNGLVDIIAAATLLRR